MFWYLQFVCWLWVARCSLFVVCCSWIDSPCFCLFEVRWLLSVVWCLLVDLCCVLFVV